MSFVIQCTAVFAITNVSVKSQKNIDLILTQVTCWLYAKLAIIIKSKKLIFFFLSGDVDHKSDMLHAKWMTFRWELQKSAITSWLIRCLVQLLYLYFLLHNFFFSYWLIICTIIYLFIYLFYFSFIYLFLYADVK